MFMHGGFTNRVSDFSWNRNDPWVMLAAADDNQMQVFRPAYSIICPPKAKSPVTMQDIED
jgi:histone-binding protein RBBP4